MTPKLWFVMSMGLLLGFVVPYPINWWLVANHLEHGMMTIRPVSTDAGTHGRTRRAAMSECRMQGLCLKFLWMRVRPCQRHCR